MQQNLNDTQVLLDSLSIGDFAYMCGGTRSRKVQIKAISPKRRFTTSNGVRFLSNGRQYGSNTSDLYVLRHIDDDACAKWIHRDLLQKICSQIELIQVESVLNEIGLFISQNTNTGSNILLGVEAIREMRMTLLSELKKSDIALLQSLESHLDNLS